MGLGKTFSSLGAVKKAELYPCVIICPKALKTNWYREIKKIDHYKTISIIDSSTKKIVDSDYIIINYDLKKTIKKLPIARSVILDEIHYLKNYKAQRTKAVQEYVKTSLATHVIGLSGTPILNKGTEILTIVNTIHNGMLDHWRFLNTYCYQGDFGGYFVRKDKVKEIYEFLSRRIMIRHTKDELNLPFKLRIPVALSRPKGYNDKLRELYGHYTNAQMMAILQVLRKWLALKKSENIISYTKSLVEDYNQKTIVFCNHIEVADHLAKELKSNVLHSQIDSATRQQVLDNFETNPNSMILVSTIGVGGQGLNLTHAKNVVFADFSYSPAHMKQAEDRIHRIGQTKRTYIHFLYAVDTIDEDLVDKLTIKQELLNGIIDGKEITMTETEVTKSITDKLRKMFIEFGQVRR
jgi:SNF2 family DNA or RNA helicase